MLRCMEFEFEWSRLKININKNAMKRHNNVIDTQMYVTTSTAMVIGA